MTTRELILNARISDFARFHIDPIEVDQFIMMHGAGCELRRSVRCPCSRPETGGARIGCPHCNGLRWLHPTELREDAVVLIVSRDPRRGYKAGGEMTTGTAWSTWPIGVLPAQGDMVLPGGEQHVVTEVLFAHQQEVDARVVRHRVADDRLGIPQVAAAVERILYSNAELTAVYWLDEERLVRARIGVDVRLRGRDIVWSEGSAPPPGTGYSVRYQAAAAYMVMGTEPVYRSENSAGLPYRCQLIRLDRWDEDDFR